MSYQIQVQVTDGTPVIASVSGTVPDGDFSIGGHEDESLPSLSVQRRDTSGNLVANCSQSAGRLARVVTQ